MQTEYIRKVSAQKRPDNKNLVLYLPEDFKLFLNDGDYVKYIPNPKNKSILLQKVEILN